VLTHLDDSPWHQLPTTFDHVSTSDPRFFDRLWFAASDRRGGGALQFTMGVYQNMNVVDGGFVFINNGIQHNLRVSRQLRPRYETSSGPLRLDVLDPMKRIGLSVAPNASGISAELEWTATDPAQEERPHYVRSAGRVLEDYSRYDQIGECSGWVEIEGSRLEIDRWWSCRDHSWGVRERVGIPEPVTGPPAVRSGGLFAFLFYSTPDYAGHVQVTGSEAGLAHLTAEVVDRATGISAVGERIGIEAEFVDDGRPRRVRRASFEVELQDGSSVQPCRALATAVTTMVSASAFTAGSTFRKPTAGMSRTPLRSPTRTDRRTVPSIAFNRYASPIVQPMGAPVRAPGV
jgi:hypothetical protein